MATEVEKAYLAGLLDGEGHIGITLAIGRPNGGWRTHVVIVTLASIHLETLRWAQCNWASGTLVVRRQPKQQVPIGNLRWSSGAAIAVLREVQPYLRIKAGPAGVALQFAAEMGQRAHRQAAITAEEWERREDLRLAIRDLNRPGQALSRVPYPSHRFDKTCAYCGSKFVAASTRKYCSGHCGRAASWQRQKERASSPTH